MVLWLTMCAEMLSILHIHTTGTHHQLIIHKPNMHFLSAGILKHILCVLPAGRVFSASCLAGKYAAEMLDCRYISGNT